MAQLNNTSKSRERFEIRKIENGYVLTETDETGIPFTGNTGRFNPFTGERI